MPDFRICCRELRGGGGGGAQSYEFSCIREQFLLCPLKVKTKITEMKYGKMCDLKNRKPSKFHCNSIKTDVDLFAVL